MSAKRDSITIVGWILVAIAIVAPALVGAAKMDRLRRERDEALADVRLLVEECRCCESEPEDQLPVAVARRER